jgi:hypothetical protein
VDTLDGHSACLVVAYLLQTGRIRSNTNVLVCFQAFLTFLATNNLTAMEMDFSSNGMHAGARPGVAAAVLLHPVSESNMQVKYNVLWRLSRLAISYLREEAMTSLHLLQSSDGDFLDAALLKGINFFDSYDLFVRIPLKSHIPAEHRNDVDAARVSLGDITPWQAVCEKASDALIHGLGDRVTTVRVLSNPLATSFRLRATNSSVGSDPTERNESGVR